MKRKLLGLTIAAGMLFAISCTRNEGTADPGTGGNDEVTVTFSVATEEAMVMTRSGEISDGSGADMLVYAVYLEDEDEPTGNRLLTYYGSDEVIDPNNTFGRVIVPGEGQTVMATDQLLTSDGQQISLRLMRGKTYRIAFWAQNHRCEAYDTADLEQVEVKYKTETGDALNNDELRDAFCASYEMEVTAGVNAKVVLTRALAQINVGTAGWDYNEEVDYGNLYAYSRIELDGAYRFINVVKDEVIDTLDGLKNKSEDTSITTNVVYDWNKLPAFLNTETVPTDAEGLKADQTNEPRLRVKLTNNTDDWLEYLPTAPGDDAVGVDGIYTETFKYLSMCYVLIPSHNKAGDKDDFNGQTFVTPLDEVRFYMAENADGTINGAKEGTFEDGNLIFALRQVPAQRNWRTNILGGAGKDNSLFSPRDVLFYIDINPSYDNDYNTGSNFGEWVEWSRE